MSRKIFYGLITVLGLGFLLIFPPYLNSGCCKELGLTGGSNFLRFGLGICRHIYWGIWLLEIACWLLATAFLYFRIKIRDGALILLISGLAVLSLAFTFVLQPYYQLADPTTAIFLVWMIAGLTYLIISRCQMQYNPGWEERKKRISHQLLKAGLLFLVILSEALLILGWLFFLNCKLPKG